MSTSRAPAHASQPDDESPPPYTLNPTDDVSLEFGPSRPFRPPPPPQHPPPLDQLHQPLSDFARDFYATGGRASRSAGNPHQQPPSRHPQTQNAFPDDGKPTRTPVPGHPLLNNGKTLVYTAGYECNKCHNTGYKSFDPSHPCRKCWEKYSKPYSGPIVYASWNDGPSNRQRPLLNLRSPVTGLSRSGSSIVGQARNDFSSQPGNSAGQSYPHPPPPPPPAFYPGQHPPPHLPPTHLPPPPPRHPPPPMNHGPPSRGPSTPLVLQPGDPRIGGKPCWNCSGTGRTLGFLLMSDRVCDTCHGIGRLL